jgi:peroxiredoxin Q/BCP
MSELKTGDIAPGFALKDQDGKTIRLSDFKGRKILLYFYPRAETPGCVMQACSIRNAFQELSSIGVAAVGISPDSVNVQKKFAGRYNLPFQLLNDEGHKVADAYGVWGENSILFIKYTGIIRSSFLIDENGKVIQAWYKVKPLETVPGAIAVLK